MLSRIEGIRSLAGIELNRNPKRWVRDGLTEFSRSHPEVLGWRCGMGSFRSLGAWYPVGSF